MFIIYMNAGGTKYDYYGFNKEQDAVDMADSLNWEITDENDFVWDLTIEEKDGDADDYYTPIYTPIE